MVTIQRPSSWTLITAMTRWNIFSIPYVHGSKCDCSEVLKIKEGSLKLFTESCYCGHNSKAVHFLHFLKEISQQSWLDKLAVFWQKKSNLRRNSQYSVKIGQFCSFTADLFCGANRFCWLHCWSMIPRWPSFKAAKHNLVFQLFRFCISTAKIEFQYTSVFVQVADFLLNDLTESETQKEMSKWFAFKILPRSCLRSCPPSCPPVCPPSWPQVVPPSCPPRCPPSSLPSCPPCCPRVVQVIRLQNPVPVSANPR